MTAFFVSGSPRGGIVGHRRRSQEGGQLKNWKTENLGTWLPCPSGFQILRFSAGVPQADVVISNEAECPPPARSRRPLELPIQGFRPLS